jgi:hypothetical protein
LAEAIDDADVEADVVLDGAALGADEVGADPGGGEPDGEVGEDVVVSADAEGEGGRMPSFQRPR